MTPRIVGQVTIPEFEVTDFDSGFLVVPGLPSDGSLCMAFLACSDSEVGQWSVSGVQRYLIVFNGGGGGSEYRQFSPFGGGGGQNALPPAGWSFSS